MKPEMIRNQKVARYFLDHFPYPLMQRFLTQGERGVLELREVAFCLKVADAHVFSRNKGFELTHNWKTFKHRRGTIYEVHVNGYNHGGIHKEFLIDIDLCENPHRACGCGRKKTCCKYCMAGGLISCKIISVLLSTLFGFSAPLTVFSGKKGFHLWFCDADKLTWSEQRRKTIASILTMPFRKHTHIHTFFADDDINPTFDCVKKLMYQLFVECMLKQLDILNKLTNLSNVIFALFENNLDVLNIMDSCCWGKSDEDEPESSLEKWNKFRKLLREHFGKKRSTGMIWKILFALCYYEIDFPVSASIAHLYKLPFSVHKSSYNIALPIPLDKMLKKCDKVEIWKCSVDQVVFSKGKDKIFEVSKTIMEDYLDRIIPEDESDVEMKTI